MWDVGGEGGCDSCFGGSAEVDILGESIVLRVFLSPLFLIFFAEVKPPHVTEIIEIWRT